MYKTNMDYRELTNRCLDMVEQLTIFNPDEIIAIVRGGMTAAHIIAKEMNLPVGIFIPHRYEFVTSTSNPQRIVFIEDIIAEGRTFDCTQNFFKLAYPNLKWLFAPVIIDSEYEVNDNRIVVSSDSYRKDWISFPWEDPIKVIVKDRGLFRNNTAQYGKEVK